MLALLLLLQGPAYCCQLQVAGAAVLVRPAQGVMQVLIVLLLLRLLLLPAGHLFCLHLLMLGLRCLVWQQQLQALLVFLALHEAWL